MSEPTGSPRLSAAVGAAIRRSRSGRFSLAELARRSRTSVGLLSLIERGQGNPSFETLVRIAGALDVPLAELIAPPTVTTAEGEVVESDAGARTGARTRRGVARRGAGGMQLGHKDGERGWRDSMLLRAGQEAVVAVRSGALELTLHDRSGAVTSDAPGEQLSVDFSVRGLPYVTEEALPPIGDPRWARLVAGATSFRPTTLASQILLTHVTRSVRGDSSPANIERWVVDLRACLLKYEDLTAGEVAQIFGAAR